MAVKIHEYFEHYKHNTIAFFALIQIFSGVLAGGIAMLLWQMLSTQPLVALTAGLITLVFLNIVFTLVMFKIASAPLRVLTQAVAHVSHDPVITPPPDLTNKRFETSGLKDMVQTIYDLAVATHTTSEKPAESVPTLFKEMADNLPCGLVALGKDGKILYANSHAPARQGTNGGQELTLIFEQNDDFNRWLAACKANKVRDTYLWTRVADNLPDEGERRIYDVAAYYQKNDTSTIEVILVAFDRTAIYQPDQEDMDFIALAAHELRGPITVIRGYLDVVKQELNGKLSAEQQQLLDRLQVSAERLSGYVTNILNVSRYDRHQFKMHPQEEQLIDILKSLVPDLALRATTQHRKLTFKIPQNLPSIAVDRSSVSEVLTNLIDNAIKYSHEGGEVLIAALPKEDMLEITVQDVGIGMPESVMGGLFNKFYRSHRSRQSVGGTGLGLYICKAIIEAHGGSIWVRSVEGQGSTFGFTLPTYASVADTLDKGDNQRAITQRSEGWIKNHAMYRR